MTRFQASLALVVLATAAAPAADLASLQPPRHMGPPQPEVPLFHPESSANFCTLFQKDCTGGETILIGKWAVPVFFP